MLEGYVAVVTGASSGIGEGLAKMLAKRGAAVALAARRGDELARVAKEIEADGGTALICQTDLLSDPQIVRLVQRAEAGLGSIDILVNAAGTADGIRPTHEIDMKSWDSEMAVNLRAPAFLCSLVLPSMRARARGFIVNICSEAGVFVLKGMGAYCISKHGLRVLTELIQEENQEAGIKAWAICPGEVATPMADWENGKGEHFLTVDEVCDVVEALMRQGPNVKMGPEVLIRTTYNPFAGSPREHDPGALED